jgi:hypothetical protein
MGQERKCKPEQLSSFANVISHCIVDCLYGQAKYTTNKKKTLTLKGSAPSFFSEIQQQLS